MKNILLITLFLLIGGKAVCQQNISYYQPTGNNTYVGSTTLPMWYQNLEKYWYYRYRLVNDFMLIGPNAGESLPAPRRRLGDNDWDWNNHPNESYDHNVLSFGSDETVDLGHYLSILATEYEQLNNNGLSTKQTLHEIQYAENAFKRLCNNASYYEMSSPVGGLSSYPGIGISNPTLITIPIGKGFFLRDDCPYLTFVDPTYSPQNWQHFNRKGLGVTPTNQLFAVNTCDGAFFASYSGTNPLNPSQNVPPGGNGRPNAESQDQLSDIFIGHALLAKYLTGDPMGLQSEAKDAIYKTVHWAGQMLPLPKAWYSIPDVNNQYNYTNGNSAANDGIFLFSAPPATKAANLCAGSSYSSQTSFDMATADNPVTGLGGFTTWAMLFEAEQIENPQCQDNIFGKNDIAFTDGYVAFANDWTFYLPPIPGGVFYSPWTALYNALALITDNIDFNSANQPDNSSGGLINTSWTAIKNHAGSNYNGTVHLPLIYELNFGDHNWYNAGYVESILNSAPPCGPYDYENSTIYTNYPDHEDYYNTSGNAYANFEWSGNDRLTEPYHRQGNACYKAHSDDMHWDDEFNGQDYMMLFNLYALERGNSYMGGMMNSYYVENYNINYPDANGYGSTTLRLKLNWLEYLSAIDHINAPNGWVDFRGAKVIDLLPGFEADKGSFFYAHIIDYTCHGMDTDAQGPYNFATVNPNTADWRIAPNGMDTIRYEPNKDNPIVYLPNGGGYVAEKLPVTNPTDLIVDSLLTPEIMAEYGAYLKQQILSSITDTELLRVVKQHFGWTDDSTEATGTSDEFVSVNIYPNPTTGQSYLIYQISTPAQIDISLTNTLGQNLTYLIQQYDHNPSAGEYKVTINSDRLTPGMYYCTVNFGGQVITKKLIVE